MAQKVEAPRRFVPALIAGGVAIVLNTLALKAADVVPLATAKGGLLRLLSGWVSVPLQQIGVAPLWFRFGGPAPDSPLFQTGFHLVVGMMMALFYAYVFEPALPRGPLVKGALYAILLWLLNAIVILPATGEGFAGSAHLTVPGIVWFAFAHTLFFMTLAVIYAWLRIRCNLKA